MKQAIKCPTYETKSFLLRKLEKDDSEELFSCYSDPLAAKFFNGDNCGISFFYDDKDKFKECVAYWLKAQEVNDFIRFTIISKANKRAVGTVEICPSSKYSYQGRKVGILRLDIKYEFETKPFMYELFGILVSNLYKDFDVDYLITKAIPQALVRLDVLKEENFMAISIGKVVPFENYYIR